MKVLLKGGNHESDKFETHHGGPEVDYHARPICVILKHPSRGVPPGALGSLATLYNVRSARFLERRR
jgi:hypothetical protein